jgi:O-antigen ligase
VSTYSPQVESSATLAVPRSLSPAPVGFQAAASFQTDAYSTAGQIGGLAKLAFFFLWLVAFAMPWENALVVPGFGTVSRVVGVLAFVAGVLAVVDSGRIRVPAIQHRIMGMFIAWAALSYFWSFDPPRTQVEAVSFLQLLALVWLIWEFAQTRKQQLLLLRGFVLGTVVSSGSIVLAFLTGGGDPHNYGRYTGLGFNPNDLALILALSLPVSVYLAARDEALRFRVWIYGGQCVMALGAILVSASRGPLLASVGTLLVVPFAFAQLDRGQKLAAGLLVGVLAVGAGLIVPQSSWSRISTIGKEVSTGTLNERTMIWHAGWVVFNQSPFCGVGISAFAPAVEHSLGMPFDDYTESHGGHDVELVAHNTFISILVEQGVIGLTLFMGILFSLALCAWKFPTLDRAFWFSVLLVWTIGVSSLTWEDRKPSWFLFGLLAAGGIRVPFWRNRRERAKDEQQQFWWREPRPVSARLPQGGRWS